MLSNGSRDMIRNCLDISGLGEFMDRRISVDEVQIIKPLPVAYRSDAKKLAVPIERIWLVTYNAFDGVGASGPCGRRW